LLAAAGESLDLLSSLVENLLDASRLQAGALAVFPRPTDLGEIVAASLHGAGPQARTVKADVPSGLRQVIADSAILERLIVNLVGNALRYSTAAPPLLLTARAVGDWVELRIIDPGPGIPEPDRKRMFLPFQRFGDQSSRVNVGFGLVVSRGLAETMGGSVHPEESYGGIPSSVLVRGLGRVPPSGHQDDLAEGGPAGGLAQFHGRGHFGQRVAGGDLRGEHAVA